MVEAVSKDSSLEKVKQKTNEEFLTFVRTVLLKVFMSKELGNANCGRRETVRYQP